MFKPVISYNKLRRLKIFEPNERFVDELKSSRLNHNITRLNDFSFDMEDFLKIAQKGTVYLFDSGEYQLNPTHKVDLTNVCDNTS